MTEILSGNPEFFPNFSVTPLALTKGIRAESLPNTGTEIRCVYCVEFLFKINEKFLTEYENHFKI